jgi:hypothetical protein
LKPDGDQLQQAKKSSYHAKPDGPSMGRRCSIFVCLFSCGFHVSLRRAFYFDVKRRLRSAAGIGDGWLLSCCDLGRARLALTWICGRLLRLNSRARHNRQHGYCANQAAGCGMSKAQARKEYDAFRGCSLYLPNRPTINRSDNGGS